MSSRKQIVLSAQKKAQNNNPDDKEIYTTGTLANIIQLLRLPDGTLKVLVEGMSRAKKHVVKYPLASKLTTGPQIPVEQAVQRAEALVEDMHDDLLAAVDAEIANVTFYFNEFAE